MKKLLTFLFCAITCSSAWGAINLTASNVRIQDCTVDKPNYYFEITASTSQATYHVCLDVWPAQASIVGTFDTDAETIKRGFTSMRKGSNTYYYMYDDCPVELTIDRINADTCQLEAHFYASRSEDGTRYEYIVKPFRFAYQTGEDPTPPTEDPYRFEPEATSITFNGQIVNVKDHRETTGWINITLVDSVNQKLDWIELDLVTDTFAMPQGTFVFAPDSADGTLIASPGYINKNDYPSYLAIRGAEWGDNTTVYYIQSGSLTFTLNAQGDSVTVQGTLTSRHGSTITVYVKSYNPFYVAPIPPRPQEEKELTIDSVVITYVGEKDGAYEYEFNFSYMEDYPNLIFNLLLPTPNSLSEGTYTMDNGAIYATLFFQNQSDFNDYFFYGTNYVFVDFELTLTDMGNGIWQYVIDMTDEVGSHYYFTYAQNPHFVITTSIKDIEEKRRPTKVLRNNRIEIEKNGVRYYLLGGKI